jgi:signal transduction histidine kinase
MEISAKEITRLERILTEMLDFARPISLVCEPSSMNEIILTCLEILEPRIRRKAITVRRRLPDGIPPVLIDRGKMEQVVINILLNAVEAVPEAGLIQVAVNQQGGCEPFITVDTRDNGPGVNSEDLPFIFDPFFSKKKKGTGLGLSNVKRIVEAHGGRAWGTNHRKGFSLNIEIPVKEKGGSE